MPKQALGAELSKYLKPPFTTEVVSLTATGFAFVPGSWVYYSEFVYELAWLFFHTS